MRTVVFVVPFPAEASLRFARSLAELRAVRLVGVVQKPPTGAAAKVFAAIERVPDTFDSGALLAVCEKIKKRYGGLHQVLAVLEPLQVPVAEVRERLGLPGTRPVTADLFRDKGRMKDALRAGALPCARHKVLHSLADAVAFEREVGFPLILKPPAGAGCKATVRVDNFEALKAALGQAKPSAENPTLAEEFLSGDEYSYDTITLDGNIRFENVSRYYPGPLTVAENPWIQWAVVLPRTLGPEHQAGIEAGRRAIARLGLQTGMTHMEWFRREDGRVAIGEIAARPPGAHFIELMSVCTGADFYRAWARAVVDGAFDGPYERAYSSACVYLRGLGHGRVQRVEGVKELQAEIGPLVVQAKLPRMGQPKAESYEGDGYIILRHRETSAVLEAVKRVHERVRIQYVEA